MNRTPLIIGHRGDSAHAPENTLAAFRLAIEAGADGIEFDVRISRDGVPVVIHDATLRRTGGSSLKISSTPLTELQKADVGSWFKRKRPASWRPEFAAETVPTLQQVLSVCEAFDGPIYVELKTEPKLVSELVNSVCSALSTSSLANRVIVKSFDLAAVKIAKEQLPHVTTAALFSPELFATLRRRKDLIATARDHGADQLSIHRRLATKRLCDAAAEAGMSVTVWTVDSPIWVERCRTLGIAALITNDPAAMIEARDN